MSQRLCGREKKEIMGRKGSVMRLSFCRPVTGLSQALQEKTALDAMQEMRSKVGRGGAENDTSGCGRAERQQTC